MRSSRMAAAAAAVFLLGKVAQAADESDQAKVVLESWGKVRLVSQSMEVKLDRLAGTLAWTVVLEAKEAVPAAPLCFPVLTATGRLAATCEGQELKPLPPPPKMYTAASDPRKNTSDQEYRRGAIHNCLAAMTGSRAPGNDPGGAWRVFDLSFAPGQKRTVRVEAEIRPAQLADSAKDGPCYAFTVPIRLGRVWARPAGKLEAAVTLGDEFKPEDVILVRPAEVKRDGRRLTLSLDGQEPVEDLIVAVKGKLPEEPKPPKPPAEPERKPAPEKTPEGRPETF